VGDDVVLVLRIVTSVDDFAAVVVRAADGDAVVAAVGAPAAATHTTTGVLRTSSASLPTTLRLILTKSPSPHGRSRPGARRRGHRSSESHRVDHGGVAEEDGRLAMLVGAVADFNALVVGIVTNAEAVAAGVARPADCDAVVAAIVSGMTATLKATDELRSSSEPSPTSLPSVYTTSPTPSLSRMAWLAPRRATKTWVPWHRLWGQCLRRAPYSPAR